MTPGTLTFWIFLVTTSCASVSVFVHQSVHQIAHQICRRHPHRHQIFLINHTMKSSAHQIFWARHQSGISLRIRFAADIRTGISFRYMAFSLLFRCWPFGPDPLHIKSRLLYFVVCFLVPHNGVGNWNMYLDVKNLMPGRMSRTKLMRSDLLWEIKDVWMWKIWCRAECLEQNWCAAICSEKSKASGFKKSDAGANVSNKTDAQTDAHPIFVSETTPYFCEHYFCEPLV